MRFYKVVTYILVMMFASSFAQAKMTEEEKVLYLKKYQTDLQQRVSEANVNINFYGKNEDQDGDPVVGAQIEYGITSYSLIKVLDVSTGFATSDSAGRFEIKNEIGTSLSIRNIKLKGYTYSHRGNPITGFDYWAHLEKNRFIPNKNEPIVFYVRKQGELTFTIQSALKGLVPFTGKYFGSLKDGRIWSNTNKRFKFQKDFEIVAHKRDGQYPILTITTLGDNAGIVLSNETIFTAPVDGYSTSLEIPCVKGKKYVFFMKNSDDLYARMEGKFRSREPDAQEVKVRITSWLNPYGDRNLETDSDIPIEIWIQLEKEAKAAFRAGKIPEKPNLQKLISGEE